ncbi:HAD family hydrolase [Novosphingobium sp. RD2P27]|uniref:HAD family hydrolase n=1 Tax=Novosphingobium kalidii TaxID=3230299 RepID=A0ABV2CXX0_9SPHN
MPIRAVFFDIDGTLVDSNDYHVSAWKEAFASEGFHFDRAAIHSQIGKGGDMLIPSLLPDADEALRTRLQQMHGEIFKGQFLERVKPFPQARELLARTGEAGKRVLLASSAHEGELEHYQDLLDARELVAASTSADDVEHTKPAPDIFAAALKKVAPLGPDEVIVVGDTPYDIEAASQCGIAAIGLLSGGFPEEALRKSGAIAVYEDVAALLGDFGGSPLGR